MKSKGSFRKIIRIAISLTLLVSTSSCIVIGLGLAHGLNGIAGMICDKTYDVTEVEKYQFISGKSFMLKHDFFYFKPDDGNEKYLAASSVGCLPPSAYKYGRNEEYWLNAQKHGKVPVFGIVKAGTQITIDMVILEVNHLGWLNHKLYALVDEGSLNGFRVNVTNLFKNISGRDEDSLPKLDHNKLEEINQNVRSQ